MITGVGFLIHVYATGHMSHDEGRRRKFFAYFNLFVAAMLLLVLGNNYVILFRRLRRASVSPPTC